MYYKLVGQEVSLRQLLFGRFVIQMDSLCLGMSQYSPILQRFCFNFSPFNVNISMGASYQVWQRNAAAHAVLPGLPGMAEQACPDF